MNLTTTTGGSIAADGVILIYMPTGYDFSSTTTFSCISSGSNTIDGTFITTTSSSTPKLITITRSGDGTATTAGTAYAIECSNVVAPSSSGLTSTFAMSTTSASGAVVATVSSGVYTTILSYGSLASASIALTSSLRYADSDLTLSFTASQSIPADGIIQITYPSDFTLSAAPTVTSSTIDGNFVASLSGQVVSVTRSAGSATSAGASLALTFASAINPISSGTTVSFQINTQSAAGSIIDQTIASLTTTISSTATMASLAVSLSRTEYGAIGDITFSFETRTAIPTDGLILLTIPTGFSFPSGYTQVASSTGSTTLDGTLTVTTSGSVITLTRSDGSVSAAGNYSILVTNIQSTLSTGITPTFGASTAESGGTLLDEYIDGTATTTIGSTGALNGASVTSSSLTVDQSTTLTFIFSTTAAIPNNGIIVIAFPAGYVVSTDSSRTAISEATARRTGCTAIDGTLTAGTPVLSTTYEVSVTRSGGTATTAGDCHSLAINLITNPSDSGITDTFSVTITDNAGTMIESISYGVTVTLEECFNSCNFNGTCTSGICYCNERMSGSYCQNAIATDFMSYLKQATYEITWADVPATQADRETFQGVSLSKIWCTCDITSDSCDLGCGCDESCSSAQLALVTEWSSTTNSSAGIRKCDEFDFWNMSQPFVTFNGRGLVYEYSHWLEDELCVQKDNNPSDGDYWKDPGELTAQETTMAISEATYQYSATPTPTPATEATTYVYGDQMKATEASSATTGNFLRLPTALDDGECVRMSRARFLVDITNNTCTYRTTALSTSCASDLSTSAYIDTLQVAATTSALDSAYVTATVSGSATASFASSTCSNALLGIAYTVIHDGAGTITTVTAVVTTGSVSADAGTDTAAVSQTFSIQFFNSSLVQPQVALSGNMGYNAGNALLAGTLSTNGIQSAILQYVDGLTVDTTVTGASATVPLCGSSSTTNRAATISFLGAASLCCDVELTLAELEAACGAYVTTQHVDSGTYLGIWGGSRYSNVADWMLMPETVAPDGAAVSTWNNETLTCHNIYYGSERLQVVYGYEGPQANPQARLVAARQEWEPQTWQWPDIWNISSSQRFQVCYTVSWRQVANISEQTSAFGQHAFYPLFINEDWGMPTFEKNIAVCLTGAFFIPCFGLYLAWSDPMSILSIQVHSLVRII